VGAARSRQLQCHLQHLRPALRQRSGGTGSSMYERVNLTGVAAAFDAPSRQTGRNIRFTHFVCRLFSSSDGSAAHSGEATPRLASWTTISASTCTRSFCRLR
jgi:hypothetical protein